MAAETTVGMQPTGELLAEPFKIRVGGFSPLRAGVIFMLNYEFRGPGGWCKWWKLSPDRDLCNIWLR